MKKLLELFFIFFRIGGLTFGGGYAMLPMIQKEVVETKKWATDDEIMNYYAVGQCTPGVIAVNTATFIGYKQGGIWGSIFATLGVISPSIIIITIIAAFISNFAHIPAVQHALGGINVVVSVLVLNAVITLWKKGVKNLFGIILFFASFAVALFTDFSPVYTVVVAVLCGILYGKMPSKKGGKSK